MAIFSSPASLDSSKSNRSSKSREIESSGNDLTGMNHNYYNENAITPRLFSAFDEVDASTFAEYNHHEFADPFSPLTGPDDPLAADNPTSTLYQPRSQNLFSRVVDSFKPDDAHSRGRRLKSGRWRQRESVLPGVLVVEDNYSASNRLKSSTPHHHHRYDLGGGIANTVSSPLDRKLRGRHLQMIAIGGSIGTGLFVGSGKVLAQGGPASVVIAYSIIGIMLYCTVHALGEMAVVFPVAGSFSAYSTRFLDPAWGFAMGWNYAMQWLIVLPLELVAARLTLEFWNHGRLETHGFIALFLIIIFVINLFGVSGYGEAEFVFSSLKVLAIVGFILLGIIINIGGGPFETGPYAGYIGGRFWRDPGAFNNGLKGLCSVFVSAAFAFAGTELIGLAAAETQNPRKSLPTAVRQVFWRITLFYVISLTIVGLLVPHTDPNLLNPGHRVDTNTSPFVIAIKNAGIQGLDSVMNAVILISVLSVGNAAVYGSSRTLASLAEQKQAPRIFAYVDRRGRPIVAVLTACIFGLLGFVGATNQSAEVLDWLLAISGLSSIFTWCSICLAHVRFRKGWHVQGHSLDELAFTSQPGVVGSWLGVLLNVLVLIAQFWTSAWPIEQLSPGKAGQVESFFSGG